MNPLPPPEKPAPTPEQTAKDNHERQLRMSYGAFFGSEHGKIVLADLKANFGWKGDVELPSAIPGLRSEEVWLREGFKQPIRHILTMSAHLPDKPATKPTTATT